MSPGCLISRFAEFFEADNQRLSMTRLLCFLAWPPATFVLVMNPTEGLMGWYLGAFVLGYVGGKGMDAATAFAKGSKVGGSE